MGLLMTVLIVWNTRVLEDILTMSTSRLQLLETTQNLGFANYKKVRCEQ